MKDADQVRISALVGAIVAVRGSRDEAGTMQCPKCGQKLVWAKVPHGRKTATRGVCETEGCLRWVE